MPLFQIHPSSYRDPSGFVFWHEGTLYRQINISFASPFDAFHTGGLSQHLVQSGLLLPYETVEKNLTGLPDWHLTLQPEVLPFISYPYEWCFEMLKDAALASLEIAREATGYGLLLKDASAYNLQWHRGRMQFIDTLSFETYDERQPWIAYRQFCEQFFAPLALMHYLQEPVQPLQLAYPDGVPLSLTKKLLPFRSKWNLHVYLHLHLGASLAAKGTGKKRSARSFSKPKLLQLLQSFEGAIWSFSLDSPSGVWSAYYDEAKERADYVEQKKAIIQKWLQELPVATAFDAGANEGEFSLLLAAENIYTVSGDFDHFSVNNLYKKIRKAGIKNIHPVLVDLSNPTPAIGVNNTERFSLTERLFVDLVIALALVHHLAIGKNIPFPKIATFFSSLAKYLIIEFVPKTDEKIRLMLEHKPDVYPWYTEEAFVSAFSAHYRKRVATAVGTSGRTLYLFERLDM